VRARKILLATRNSHKTAEFRAILGAGWEVEDLQAHPDFPEVEETGETFAENAALKALAASAQLDPETYVLADDSGLAVDALDGAPGVHSARYAADAGTRGNSDDATNRCKLIGELARIGASAETEATARFICYIAVARGGKSIAGFEGTVEGRVIAEERGAGGFGYDPLFVPAGYAQTFGELPAETKNRLSHRAAALAKAAAFLREQT
jgi:XTP/dITP diphosphohydrolase